MSRQRDWLLTVSAVLYDANLRNASLTFLWIKFYSVVFLFLEGSDLLVYIYYHLDLIINNYCWQLDWLPTYIWQMWNKAILLKSMTIDWNLILLLQLKPVQISYWCICMCICRSLSDLTLLTLECHYSDFLITAHYKTYSLHVPWATNLG